MKKLRFATPEEVESVRAKSDLTGKWRMLALDTPHGPILSVLRQIEELDPVHYPEGCEDRYKVLNQNNLESYMFGAGIEQFYFNVKDSDEKWKNVVKTYGAVETSEAPEIRFKKVL
jgi:hypothetical protein